jgi:hypothetical protein
MTSGVLGPVVYRFRSQFIRRRGGYLGLVLLIGLLGGVAMGAVAGARRTQASFPVYLASTNPSDVQLFTEFDPITNTGYSPRIDHAIARMRGVRRSVDYIGFDGTEQILGGATGVGLSGQAPPSFEGSLNGAYLAQDQVTLVAGRLAHPSADDEFVITAGGASQLGLHIGSVLRMAFFTDAQVNSVLSDSSASGSATDKPYLTIRLKLVGLVRTVDQIVQDDDTALQNQVAILTPALTSRLATCCAYYSYVGLQLRGGAGDKAAVLSEAKGILPNLGPTGAGQTNAPLVAKAERAVRPESIAFGVFGLIAALAALLICGQVVSRLLSRNAEDGAILRALGAGPAVTVADGLVGIVGAVVAGSVVAMAVAIGLSPLAPVGAVRPVYPDPGVAFDWTVLGAGFALLVVVLSATAVLIALRVAPHRAAKNTSRARHPSSLAGIAAVSGLPPAAVTGIRAALGSGSRRDTVPVRSAVLAAVLAVVVVVTSITFGASLNALVSRPSLYGWNWDFALLSGFSGQENLPAAETASLLEHDSVVAHFTGVYLLEVRLDGQGVPALVSRPNAAVGPAPLAGRGLQSAREVVLGTATLAALHKHVGDTVTAATKGSHPTSLRIVGTATLPTIKGSGESLQMGTGAVVSPALFSGADLNIQGSPVPGPNAELITLRPGVSRTVALRSLDRITRILNRPSDGDGPIGGVVPLLRPAEIADYRSVGSTPSFLAGILATGALGALGLTLVASVRRRRREFALLKGLGLTGRQLAASVAWQSSVSAVIGVIFGVPLGIALGRWLWTLFARGISAVPDPTVPVLSIILVAVGALVFANLVASVPGRVASRTPTAVLLRTD